MALGTWYDNRRPTTVFSGSDWLLVSATWLFASFGSGAALAWLYKRLHPSLSFHKLWAFWTTVLSVVVALMLWLA